MISNISRSKLHLSNMLISKMHVYCHVSSTNELNRSQIWYSTIDR